MEHDITKLKEYQVIVNGMPVSIVDLDRAELIVQLAHVMKLMEMVDDTQNALKKIVDEYRN